MRKEIDKIFLAILTIVLCLMFGNTAQADYKGVVLSDNPLLYLRFQDANMNHEASANDIGSVNRDGTYSSKGGANSITPVSSIPYLGQAANLGQEITSAGNGDCVDVWDYDLAFSLPDVTYEVWFRMEQDILADFNSVLFQHTAAYLEEGSPGLVLLHNEYGIRGGDTTNYGFIAPTDDGNWHHLVVTYDSTGSGVLEELYVNGIFIGAASAPNDLSYDWDSITIGGDGHRWYLWDEFFGDIDEFAVYDGVLSADRILAHYEAGIGCPDSDCDGICNACVAEYHSIDVPKYISEGVTTRSYLDIVAPGSIIDLDVKLNISMEYNDYLVVGLTAPDNWDIILFAGLDGSGIHNTILDDEAAVPITSGSPPYSGSYQPMDSLSDFDGKSATGTWELFLLEFSGMNGGTLYSWSLVITSSCVDSDNCPDVYNPDQADSDGDNIGDECECETANLDSIDPVNFVDFAILGEDWWDSGPGDTNRDNVINFIDLLQVIEHWLEECSQ